MNDFLTPTEIELESICIALLTTDKLQFHTF